MNARALERELETIGNGMKRYRDRDPIDALKYAADQFQSISQFEPHRKQFLGTGKTSSAMKNSMNKLKEVYAHYRNASAIHTSKAAPAPRTIDAMHESVSSTAAVGYEEVKQRPIIMRPHQSSLRSQGFFNTKLKKAVEWHNTPKNQETNQETPKGPGKR